MTEILEQIVNIDLYANVNDRGDITTLKDHFDGDYVKFIYAWGMREPALVEAFYRGGFACAKQVSVKYRYLPLRLVKHMKPAVIKEKWDVELVTTVAKYLKKAMESQSINDYYKLTKIASKLPGVGQYSKEHLYRTACLLNEIPHPCKKFVEMGGGSNYVKYNPLRQMGIFSIRQLNEKLQELYPNSNHIDAGNLAYIICMLNKE